MLSFLYIDPECGPLQRLRWAGPIADFERHIVRSSASTLLSEANCLIECEKMEYCTHVYHKSLFPPQCVFVYEDVDIGELRDPPETFMLYYRKCASKNDLLDKN